MPLRYVFNRLGKHHDVGCTQKLRAEGGDRFGFSSMPVMRIKKLESDGHAVGFHGYFCERLCLIPAWSEALCKRVINKVKSFTCWEKMPTSRYTVWWTGRVDKRMKKLPAPQKVKLNLLIKDLREKGPIQKESIAPKFR